LLLSGTNFICRFAANFDLQANWACFQVLHPCAHGLFVVQAAILTGRRSKTGISVAEIDDSVDRIVAGMEGTPMVDSKSKSLVAYHEVGHAVCGTLTPGKFSYMKQLSDAL
jgi:hypothetical protein